MATVRHTRRGFLKTVGTGVATLAVPGLLRAAKADRPKRMPNIVIVFTDDQGYSDVGVYGAQGFQTPHLDRMASEGVRFTDFYVAQPVCSASRAALLTGCYPNRIGITGALGPNSTHGIHEDEVTIAELCKPKGYATAVFGKWHLGHHKEFLPIHHGFDEYCGIPYSNDMWPLHPDLVKLSPDSEKRKRGYPDLPLIEGDQIVDPKITPEDQVKFTTLFTQRAVDFIGRNRDRPFFLYLAHPMPHVPLFVSDKHRGKSEQGLYGDVISEIDWSVGQILEALERHGLEEDTLVIFTADNGPWLSYGNHAGSARPLREGKGTTWEGGIREPMFVKWPGVVKPGTTCDTPVISTDFFPTILEMAGAKRPPGKTLDGESIVPLLKGQTTLNREAIFWHFPAYLQGNVAGARDSKFRTRPVAVVRKGGWKLMLFFEEWVLDGGQSTIDTNNAVELYNLADDISETNNLADTNKAKRDELLNLLVDWQNSVGAPIPTTPNPDYSG